MAQVWTCPACGTSNSIDESACTGCGRWASIFDLERTVEIEQPERVESELGPEPRRPEPVVPAGPRPSTSEVVQSVLDALRERTSEGTPDTEAETERPRSTGILKWLFVALVVLWFVLPPLLDALR